MVVVTEDSSSSHQLHTELRFIHANMENFLSFPEWETLPYDVFSPHQDIISERLASLSQLQGKVKGVLTNKIKSGPKVLAIKENLIQRWRPTRRTP